VQQNAEAQQFLERALSDFRVIVTASAYETVRRLNNELFDAYVLDYWLPDWSGVGLCREIRKTDPHVPICFYTTAAGSEHEARALRAGASAFIQAPVDAAPLCRRLHALIERSDIASLQARTEEERVIQQELERQAAAAVARAERAMETAAKAIENSAKVKAFKAYLAAGGARAHFERWWPQQFDTCWAGRSSETESDSKR
jgi:DNA-binding response OmpR family regulator